MDKESTPLLSNPKGAGRLLINQPQQIINAGLGEGPTRRRNGQHHQSSSSSSSSTSPLSSLSQSINSNHHKNDIHIGSNNNNNGSKTTKLYNNNSNNNSNNNNNNNNVNNRTIFQQISASAHVLRQAIRPITRGNGGGRSSNNKSNNNNNKSTRNDIIRSFSVDSGSNSHAIYYEDNYNDLPWKCSFGTGDNDGIWMNTTDKPGIIMSCMVWIMILYSGLTVTILAKNNALHSIVASIYCTLCALALSAHAKTTFTDPGVIPKTAVPTEEDGLCRNEFPMCSVCETYKPKHCHHCRICNRCVSGMDHHCPWMNNCIGRGNMKHFFLFLVYVWLASAYALSLFTLNYFLCNNNDECTFPDVLVTLVRIMTLLCMGAICFTSSMIMNVLWGMMTGLGTIDRMKREESQNYDIADELPIHWKDVFGIQHYVTWFFPIDPVFEDYDRIMGYSTIPRLQREKKLDSCNNLV